MLADPITIPAATWNWSGSYPAATESGIQSVVFNKVPSPGTRSVYKMSPVTLAALSLSAGTLTVSHEVTAKSRSRSLFRMDITKADSNLVDHGVSVGLTIDRESKVSSETTAALSKALGGLLLCLVGIVNTDELSSTEILAQFLNGEA
jgi:hypothetical protein